MIFKWENFEEAITVVKEYENVLGLKKIILNVAFRQGKIFKKFKESKKFVEMVKELGFNQSTIYLEINLLTMLVKYPKLKKF